MKFKFNIGDKVKIKKGVKFSKYENGRCILSVPEEILKYEGKELTIEKIGGQCRYDFPVYQVKEDKSSNGGFGYTWAEEWLEPVSKSDAVTISFTASTKEEAMMMAKKIIEKSFTPKEWTAKEIAAAKEEVIRLVTQVTREGGDVTFSKSSNCIMCDFYKDSFSMERRTKFSEPHGEDVFNPWIGKCVALCKAMKEPIPSFILNKNK